MSGIVLHSPSMLKVVKTLRVLPVKDSKHQVRVAELSDGGRYYVKGEWSPGSGTPPHCLLAEAIGLMLARSLRLPTPEHCFVKLPDSSTGTATLDVATAGVREPVTKSVLSLPKNLIIMAASVRLDMLVGNRDRHRKNVLMVRPLRARQPRIVLIDYDQSFVDLALRIDDYLDDLRAAFGLSDQAILEVKRATLSELRRIQSWMRSVAETSIMNWVKSNAPSSWISDSPSMVKTIRMLPRRAAQMADLIEKDVQGYHSGGDLWVP